MLLLQGPQGGPCQGTKTPKAVWPKANKQATTKTAESWEGAWEGGGERLTEGLEPGLPGSSPALPGGPGAPRLCVWISGRGHGAFIERLLYAWCTSSGVGEPGSAVYRMTASLACGPWCARLCAQLPSHRLSDAHSNPITRSLLTAPFYGWKRKDEA